MLGPKAPGDGLEEGRPGHPASSRHQRPGRDLRGEG